LAFLLLFGRPAVGILVSEPDARAGRADGQSEKGHDEDRRGWSPPGPFDGAFGESDRAGLDRLALQKTAEGIRQFAGARVAPGGGFVKALETDCLQITGHPGVELRRGDRVL